MLRALRLPAVAAGLAASGMAEAGPVSAGQGTGPLGPVWSDCAPGNEAVGRAGCRPFRSNDASRRDDLRCAERPTSRGTIRLCRD